MGILRRYGKFAFKVIKAEMPWNQYKLRKKGAKFVLNYSDEGNAKLAFWFPYSEVKIDIVSVSDRQCEYPFTVEKFCEYNIKDKDVLDVGSAGSVLPPILSALGNRVVCIDVREWPIVWPNLKSIKADLLKSDIPFESFDVITCISTIEHFGLGRYGDSEDIDGDIKGMDKLRQYLKPGGLMVLTVPFGTPTVVFPGYRVYDNSRFLRLITGFKVLDKKFFEPIGSSIGYQPCSEEETYSGDTVRKHAIICSLLQKQKL